MKAPLALALLLCGCAGTGPKRSLEAFLVANELPEGAPVVVVDLDDTVYERSLERPMPGATEALQELAQDHLIVYLTARPTYAKVPWVTENRRDSLEFLEVHGFPDGPLFTSSLWNLLVHGQGGGKKESLAQLQAFGVDRVSLAVGDRPHDLEAYLDNGIIEIERSVIILIEDDEHSDRDRDELPADAFDHVLQGSGPAWPRIRVAYRSGDLERDVGVVSQPPERPLSPEALPQ